MTKTELLSEIDKKKKELFKLQMDLREIEMQEPQNIIGVVAEKYGVGAFEVISGIKIKEVVEAKAEICYRMRALNYTYERIAMLLGMKSHGSIIYLVKKYKKTLQNKRLAF